jgi:hypothetical protein
MLEPDDGAVSEWAGGEIDLNAGSNPRKGNDMTTKEKLRKALEALQYISNGIGDTASYAREVYAELTTPRMETVEVKRWKCQCCEWISDEPRELMHSKPPIELTGSCQRPVPEPEEKVWEGTVRSSVPGTSTSATPITGIVALPLSLVGCRVEVRLKEGE